MQTGAARYVDVDQAAGDGRPVHALLGNSHGPDELMRTGPRYKPAWVIQ